MEIVIFGSNGNILYADIIELVGERRLSLECIEGDLGSSEISLSVEQALELAAFINKWFKPDGE